jgi:hypothetical protein
MKTHWKKLENPDYIGAYSLDEGKDKKVTIVKVIREMVTGTGGKKEECTIAHLKNEKPMILNRTNMKTIQKIYNTPYIEEWAGKSIVLYVAKIKAFGEDNVECLRIRPKQPTKEDLNPNHAKWKGAIQALINGATTIEAIKKTYTLTENNQKLLVDASI